MSTDTHLTGGCHCGAVRYECSGEPVISATCHCTDCARISGAAGASAVAVARDTVHVTGEVSWYASPGDSGKMVNRGFCPRCGTRLFGKPDLAPDLMSISLLSLDDPSAVRPQMNLYTKSAAPWAASDTALTSFEGMPPMPVE